MIRLLVERGADPNRGGNNSSPLKTAKLIADYPTDTIELLEENAQAR